MITFPPKYPPISTELDCDCGTRIITLNLCEPTVRCPTCGKIMLVDHEPGAFIPSAGKHHLTVRKSKAWAGWLFTLAKFFRIDIDRLGYLYDTIDCGDVICTSVDISFEHGQAVVTAKFKGEAEDE